MYPDSSFSWKKKLHSLEYTFSIKNLVFRLNWYTLCVKAAVHTRQVNSISSSTSSDMSAFRTYFWVLAIAHLTTHSNFNTTYNNCIAPSSRWICFRFATLPAIGNTLLPLELVYNKADWKQAWSVSVSDSSMEICIANAASGLTLGNERRSVDRTKKFPWNVWILRPEKNKQVGIVSK